MASKPVIGIDLGTTYSAVAVCRNGKIEVIPNNQGNRLTPSYVAYTDTEQLVGEGAVYQAHKNAENTIYGVKRLIGRTFNDPEVMRDVKLWPFKVIEDNDQIKICVKENGKEKVLSPEEVSAVVLSKMRKTAEDYLDVEVKDVVITVPAYFNGNQRIATENAAKIAGLNVLRMIHEPTAAALAYMDTLSADELETRRMVLIYDLGGGTFDISILNMKGKSITVVAVTGDTHLGGEDFDNILVEHFIEEFKLKHDDTEKITNLRTHCERIKRYLSTKTQESFLLEGTNLEGTITRAKFEDLCIDLFEKSIKLVDEVLKEAKLCKEDINDVVLVGGSSRIPKIQELLSEYFNGKQLKRSLHLDESVAYGAAIQAMILDETQDEQSKGLMLCDVCPLSLGVELKNGQMHTYIPRNSPIPCQYIQPLQAARANSTSVIVKIYEGERFMCEENHFLGQFELDGICSTEQGGGKIDITFEIDANGILSVKAIEPINGIAKAIKIINKSRLNETEIQQMVKAAQENNKKDELLKQRIESIDNLERLVFEINRKVKTMVGLDEEDKKLINIKCDQVISLLHQYRPEVKENIDRYCSELKSFWQTILKKIDG